MKVTMITGASCGIGEALAIAFAKRNKNLLLIARNSTKLEELCSRLSKEHGVKAQYISADLTEKYVSERIFLESKNRRLEVECLINNAGIGSGGEFSELSLSAEMSMMQLNMNSLVSLTHYFLQEMSKRKDGTIINVASLAAFMPVPYMAVYAASKVFVRSFTEAIHEECKRANIHIMLLVPGLTKTNFMNAAGLANSKGDALTAGAALQTPQEVADEAMRGLDSRKRIVVSGFKNRWGARLISLVPKVSIAKSIAKSFQQQLGL